MDDLQRLLILAAKVATGNNKDGIASICRRAAVRIDKLETALRDIRDRRVYRTCGSMSYCACSAGGAPIRWAPVEDEATRMARDALEEQAPNPDDAAQTPGPDVAEPATQAEPQSVRSLEHMSMSPLKR